MAKSEIWCFIKFLKIKLSYGLALAKKKFCLNSLNFIYVVKEFLTNLELIIFKGFSQ